MANSASGLISFWMIDRVSGFGLTAQREGTSTIIWRSSLLIVVLPEKGWLDRTSINFRKTPSKSFFLLRCSRALPPWSIGQNFKFSMKDGRFSSSRSASRTEAVVGSMNFRPMWTAHGPKHILNYSYNISNIPLSRCRDGWAHELGDTNCHKESARF